MRASLLDKRCVCLTHGKRSGIKHLAVKLFVLDQAETRNISIEDVEGLLDVIAVARIYVNIANPDAFEVLSSEI
mgnify:CR=1 FL=1